VVLWVVARRNEQAWRRQPDDRVARAAWRREWRAVGLLALAVAIATAFVMTTAIGGAACGCGMGPIRTNHRSRSPGQRPAGTRVVHCQPSATTCSRNRHVTCGGSQALTEA
jgi:hypothetical protein